MWPWRELVFHARHKMTTSLVEERWHNELMLFTLLFNNVLRTCNATLLIKFQYFNDIRNWENFSRTFRYALNFSLPSANFIQLQTRNSIDCDTFLKLNWLQADFIIHFIWHRLFWNKKEEKLTGSSCLFIFNSFL